MIRALIIDDEEPACKALEALVHRHVPEITNTAWCTSPQEAIEVVREFNPSVVFLDIKMPHLSGFDFLTKLGEWRFDVIFTTAFDQYAIQAIRFSALDYLLKPIDPIELKAAVKAHMIRKNHGAISRLLVRNLISNFEEHDEEVRKIALHTTEGVHFFSPNEIIRCESERNYTWFHVVHQKPLIVSKTLKEFDELLTPYGFIRSHKSHLVNSRFIQRLDTDGTLTLTDGSRVPVSRRKKETMVKIFQNWLS